MLAEIATVLLLYLFSWMLIAIVGILWGLTIATVDKDEHPTKKTTDFVLAGPGMAALLITSFAVLIL